MSLIPGFSRFLHQTPVSVRTLAVFNTTTASSLNQRTYGPVNTHMIPGLIKVKKNKLCHIWHCRKIGRFQLGVIVYIQFVELELHHAPCQLSRSQDTFSSGEEGFKKGFTIHVHDGHPGHVVLTISIKFLPTSDKDDHHQIWLSSASQFQRRCLKLIVTYMYIFTRQEQKRSNLLINIMIQSI